MKEFNIKFKLPDGIQHSGIVTIQYELYRALRLHLYPYEYEVEIVE